MKLLQLGVDVMNPAISLPDSTWEPVSRKYMVRRFHPYFRGRLDALGLKYGPRFDCNRFGRLYAAEAQVAYAFAVDPEHTQGEAACVWEIEYKPDAPGPWHEAVAAITDDDEELKWVEPQGPMFVNLSATEIQTIRMMR